MRFFRFAHLLPLAGLLSCSDPPTQPQSPPPVQNESPVTVTLSVSGVSAPALTVTPDSLPVISCRVGLVAAASKSGTRFTWGNWKLRWYIGPTRTIAADSQTYAISTANPWDRADIGPGDSLQSTVTLSASAPFEASFDFLTGDPQAVARAACGPRPADVAHTPTVSTVTTTPPGGALKTGDSLTIQFTAHSDDGLWAVEAYGEGACDFGFLFPGRLGKDLTRTARFAIPSGCDGNGALSVGATAFDGVLHQATKTVPTLAYSDPTPPSLSVSVPAVLLLTTDTLPVSVNAADNNALKTFAWEFEPTGAKDSAGITGTAAHPVQKIPVPLTAVGADHVRFAVRDRVGLSSPAISDSVRVLQGNRRPYRIGSAPDNPVDVRIDTRRGVAYEMYGDRIWIMSLSSGGVIDSFSVGHSTAGLEITPGGDSLLVSIVPGNMDPPSVRYLDVIDLTAPIPGAIHPVVISALGAFPNEQLREIVATAGGTAFIATNGGHLVQVNLANGTQTLRADIGTGNDIGTRLERSLDGLVFFGTSQSHFERYQTSTDAFQQFALGPYGQPPTLDRTANRAVFGTEVFDGSMTFVQHMDALGADPFGINAVLSPDGDYVYNLVQSVGFPGQYTLVIKNRVTDGVALEATRLPVVYNQQRLSDDGTRLAIWGVNSKVTFVDLR